MKHLIFLALTTITLSVAAQDNDKTTICDINRNSIICDSYSISVDQLAFNRLVSRLAMDCVQRESNGYRNPRYGTAEFRSLRESCESRARQKALIDLDQKSVQR